MARGRAKHDPDTGFDTQPEFEPVDGHRSEPERAGRVRPVKRARFGVVVLTVLLTELLLIAAGANQGVSKHLASYADDHPKSLLGNAVRSLLVLRWSVSASGHSDLWHAELITVGLVLLLGIVLVPMVVHGPMSWLRAFVGTWFTVTVSVGVATIGGLVLSDLVESRDFTGYVVPGTPATGLSVSTKIADAVFGGVLTYAFVAGLGLGLVVGLVVATVVCSTRRTDPVPVAVAAVAEPASNPESPQPFFGNSEDERSTRTGGYGTARLPDSSRYADARPYADSHPYASPDRRAAENETAALPAVDAAALPGYGERSQFLGGDHDLDSTTTLPRIGGDRPPVRSDAGATGELPRTQAAPAASPVASEPEVEPASEPVSEPASEPTSESASGATQAWPAQRRPSSEPDAAGTDSQPTGSQSTASQSTAAFPLPPDDEDLGRHPDHHDD